MLTQAITILPPQTACLALAGLFAVGGAAACGISLHLRGWRPPDAQAPVRVDPDAALAASVDAEVGGARIVGRSQAGLVTARSSGGYAMVRQLREVPELEDVPVDFDTVAALDALPLVLSKNRDECLCVGYSTCRGSGDAIAFAVGRRSAVFAMGPDEVLHFPRSSSAMLTPHGGLLVLSVTGAWAFTPRIASVQSQPLAEVMSRFEDMSGTDAQRLLRERQVRLKMAGISRGIGPRVPAEG